MKLLECAIYITAIGFLSNPIAALLPRSWFQEWKFPYRTFRWEDGGKIYNKLHIRTWKDRVPDVSKHIRTMVPKAVSAKPTVESLNLLIQETCVAEAVHWVLIFASLTVLKIWKGVGGWVCYFLCLLGNLPFIIIQRYNRPRLVKTRDRLQSRVNYK